MANWHLMVKTTHGEYDINIGPDEPKALAALQEAGDNIGLNGRVTIAQRLVLESNTIQSAMIVRRSA